MPAGKQDNQDNGKVTIKVGTTNLKEVSDLTTLYGEITDYTSVSDVQWQLFYDDDGWIYLIASDYVSNTLLPSELSTDGQSTTYCATFNYPATTFTGNIMENELWSKGTESNTIVGNLQTNKYLKWVNSSVVSTKNNPNMKAVSYMMDTSKWNNFAGDINGSYAIGGPTLEMFVLSYNAKHDTKLGTYNTVDSNNANSNGYMVKIGEGSWANNATGLDRTAGNMWVKIDTDKAYGMWLASPSSHYEGYVSNVYCYGLLNYYFDTYGTNIGFRPLVAIPKSSLK